MGHKKGKNEEPEPKQQQNKKNPNWPEQQQNKLVHGSPISSGPPSENKEDMQQIWGSGVLQRRTNIRSLLMAPKDKNPVINKSGVIYRYKCSEHGCNEEYIGESARNL